MSVELSFAVTFIKQEEAQEFVEQPDAAEPEKEEVKDEVAESESAVNQTATGWEGWKTLLNLEELLPKGVSLPPPNTDPSYIPSPPKPTFTKISPRGETTI